MDAELIANYRTLNEANVAISRAETLDQALQDGLKAIVRNSAAESAVIWYLDGRHGSVLRPFFWIGPTDLTARTHQPGEGAVGRVFESQQPERYLRFAESDDPSTVADFTGMGIEAMLCVPLTTKSGRLGCVQFVNRKEGGPLSGAEADVCEMMVMVAAMAIDDNERLLPEWTPGEVVMRVRDITREFQNGDEVTRVLKGVNLDVYQGEFLVLLGESGCGKSTLLNILGGMDHPTGGLFEFRGEDLSRASQRRLTDYRRDNVGFIFQSYNLMPNLTAAQNLDLIASLVPDHMSSDEALRIVNLSDRRNNYPSQMSGGQQQRVSIARALINRPSIVMADEPTAALDYATSIEVLSVMENIIAEGATMIMVTHNEEICRMADRVVRMRNGQMDEVTINRRKAHAAELVW